MFSLGNISLEKNSKGVYTLLTQICNGKYWKILYKGKDISEVEQIISQIYKQTLCIETGYYNILMKKLHTLK